MDFNIGNLVSGVMGAVAKVATAVVNSLSSTAKGGGLLGGIAGVIVGVAEAVLGVTTAFANANEDGEIDEDEAEELLENISKLLVGAFIATFSSGSSGTESDDDGKEENGDKIAIPNNKNPNRVYVGESGDGFWGKIGDSWVSTPVYDGMVAIADWQDSHQDAMDVLNFATIFMHPGSPSSASGIERESEVLETRSMQMLNEEAKIEKIAEKAGKAVDKQPSTVDELINMMNKREKVNSRFATGDEESYLKAVDAEASHMMMENGTSDMMFRKDVSSRWTAYHEWLHRCLQNKNGAITPGEDTIIEKFLERHKELFKIGN